MRTSRSETPAAPLQKMSLPSHALRTSPRSHSKTCAATEMSMGTDNQIACHAQLAMHLRNEASSSASVFFAAIRLSKPQAQSAGQCGRPSKQGTSCTLCWLHPTKSEGFIASH